MYVDWLPSYSVDVVEIDDQHKKFVLLINDLYDALEIGCVDIVLGDILAQLHAYANYHFATEEKYFHRFGYSGAEEHERIHQHFRETVADLKNNYVGHEGDYAKKTMEFMKNWLTHHIISKDHGYIDCFKEHGLE